MVRTSILLTLFCFTLFQITSGQIFEQEFDGPNFDASYGSCLRSNGNHLILGYSFQTGSGRSTIIEMDVNGDTVWTKQIQLNGSNSYTEFKYIAERADGKIVLGGNINVLSGGTILLALCDSAANVLDWEVYRNINGNRALPMQDMIVDSAGNIYVASYYADIFSGGVNTDYWDVPVLLRFQPDLSLDWAKTYGTHTQRMKSEVSLDAFPSTSKGISWATECISDLQTARIMITFSNPTLPAF